MIIPPDGPGRVGLFTNVLRECGVSRDARRAQNRLLRAYALTGSNTGERVRRNKVIEFVETSSAMIYASELVQLHPRLPRSYADSWIEELDAARDVVSDLFVDSGTDQAYGLMVFWAHIYPSMFGKVMTSDNQVGLEVIQDPADLGVWRERLDSIDKQEAITHHFDMDVASFERLIRQSFPQDKATADEIISDGLDRKRRGGGSGSLLAPAGLTRVLLAGASGVTSGAVQGLTAEPVAVANEHADVVPMVELWIRDDYAYPACKHCTRRQGDDAHQDGPLKDHEFEGSGEHEWEWRKVLALGDQGDRILWSSLNPLLRQRQPFRQLCLQPVTNYLWGVAPIEKLLRMQDWSEELLDDNMFLLKLQIRPPTGIIGMASVDGEKAKLLFTPEGVFTMPPAPQASIQRFPPDTPPDLAGTHRLVDENFDKAGGLPMGSQAQTDPSVRSAGQMTAGAMLSSPRTSQRAMKVEDCLEEIMTDETRLHRRISKERLRVALPEPNAEKDPEGHAKWREQSYREFLLSQMPGDLSVRVSAHSASPLFRNQAREDAIVLKREGAIDLETFVEAYQPAMEDVIRAKARRIQKAGAAFKERQLEVAETKAKAAADKAARTK